MYKCKNLNRLLIKLLLVKVWLSAARTRFILAYVLNTNGKKPIRLYTDDVPPRVLALKAAISSNDANKIKQIAHSIKGVSVAISGLSVADLAGNIEHGAATMDQ
jgi:hypothetical protein